LILLLWSVLAHQIKLFYLLTPTSLRLSTLSSASLERGLENLLSYFFYPLSFFKSPLSAEGEERVVQRSVDRVSQLYAMQIKDSAF
jgi:uncharacterized membrane protein YciS (DUF1049 family)